MAALDFRGQTVWVTGAGKGIGYATALAFVEAGANVTGFDLAFDGESYPFATETLDVADADQVREACSRLLANTERLDVLVNAAGILRMGATDQRARKTGSRPSRSTSAARSTCFSRRWPSSVASGAGRSSPSPPMPRTRRVSA